MTETNRWPWLFVPSVLLVAFLTYQEKTRLELAPVATWSILTTGILIVTAGLFIWRRRPNNRCWWMISAAGFAWFVGDFEHSIREPISVFAFSFGRWQGALLAWALLAYPGGRIETRRGRAVMVSLVFLFSMRSLSRLFLHMPPDVAGYGTTNRFLPITDDRWWRLVENIFGWGYPLMMLAVLVIVSDQWLRASRPGRRMLSPALVAVASLTAIVLAETLAGWNAVVGSNVRVFQVVSYAYVVVAWSLAVGLIRLRQTRSAVVDLVAELAGDGTPVQLGPALARALGDPTLQLLPWSEAAMAYVDNLGSKADLDSFGPGRAVTRIERQDQPVAIIVHDIALLEDPGLVNAVVAAVRLTIDNADLQAEIERQLAEVEASRARIVEAGDAERRKIERDLHDGAQQRLVTTALALRLAAARLGENVDPSTRTVLAQAVKELGEALDELRDLARGIHPAILSESGLVAALESLVDRSGLPVDLEIHIPEEPPTSIAATAYFAVSEALTNTLKHATASRVKVRAVVADGLLDIIVTDDGRGGATATTGSGLSGIADRAAAVGGVFHLHSPHGDGTRFELKLPCASS